MSRPDLTRIKIENVSEAIGLMDKNAKELRSKSSIYKGLMAACATWGTVCMFSPAAPALVIAGVLYAGGFGLGLAATVAAKQADNLDKISQKLKL